MREIKTKEDFRGELRRWMAEEDKPMARLAETAGKTEQIMSQYLCGRIEPKLGVFLGIMQAMGRRGGVLDDKEDGGSRECLPASGPQAGEG